MKNPRAIALIAISAAVLILLFQNLQMAVVHLFFWDISMPLVILIFAALLAGFVGGYLAGAAQEARATGARGDGSDE